MIKAQNTDFLFMIEKAIRAPSGHNAQPWLFKINNNSIEIHPNYDKILSVVDFDNREFFISLGCATENLCITASQKGYDSDVSINQEGIITVELIQNEHSDPDPLFRQIDVRQTNRSVFNGNIVPSDSIEILKAIPVPDEINSYFYKIGTAQYDTISSYIYRGNIIQMQDKAFKEELRGWMRYNKKHQDETKDGLSYAVFGAPNLPKFIVKPIITNTINENYQNKGDKKKLQSASHLVLFTTNNNSIENWINLGRYFERVLLKSTEMGIVHSHFNQPNELKELSAQMAESLNIPDKHTAILIRLGYGEKMPYSKRKNVEDVLIN